MLLLQSAMSVPHVCPSVQRYQEQNICYSLENQNVAEYKEEWRRRESNPRPKAFSHSVYMLFWGNVFRILPTTPAGQGRR